MSEKWGITLGLGWSSRTTNNRMELLAAIRALETIKKPSHIIITTDSQYLKQGITEWIHLWKKRGWKTSDKKPVKNSNLWKAIDALCENHDIQWEWVKGHNGHPENEIADNLAVNAIKSGLAGALKEDLAGLLTD